MLDERATTAGCAELSELDGQWLLPGGWQEKRLTDEYGLAAADASRLAKNGAAAASALKRAMSDRKVETPPAHLAVIVQDVDRLGSTLVDADRR